MTPQTVRHRQDLQQRPGYNSDMDNYGVYSTQRQPSTVPRSRHGRSDAERRVDSHHLEPRFNTNLLEPRVSAHRVEPRVSAHRMEYPVDPPRSGPRVDPPRSEPRVGSHRMEARVVNNRIHDTRRGFGRGSSHSSPPSPTPLSRTLSHQFLTTPTHQGPDTPVVTQSHSNPEAEPVFAVTDHVDLGDIYHLDKSYVRLRNQGCVRAIHTPPRGQRGPKGRWYIVSSGKKVGVFNDWFVRALVWTSSLTNDHSQE